MAKGTLPKRLAWPLAGFLRSGDEGSKKKEAGKIAGSSKKKEERQNCGNNAGKIKIGLRTTTSMRQL